MSTLDEIKKKMNDLYNTNAKIHISVSMTRPRVHVQNDEATLTGVYPHVFRVEAHSGGQPTCYTIQYADLLTRNITIAELDEQ